MTILDVGHGNCAILQDSNGVVVIDAGLGNSLEIYLREQGIRRIDVILISHADQDHLGGLISLLASQAVEIGRVRLNTDSLQGSSIAQRHHAVRETLSGLQALKGCQAEHPEDEAVVLPLRGIDVAAEALRDFSRKHRGGATRGP
ncbi:MAG: MBL fold metallo-hydrolase [Thermoanaerobaculia bacterium]